MEQIYMTSNPSKGEKLFSFGDKESSQFNNSYIKKKRIPTLGIEHGPAGWEPASLKVAY